MESRGDHRAALHADADLPAGLGWAFDLHIPGVFFLLAAMPVAFYTMVVAAVFDQDRELARLLVAVSTPVVIIGVLVWQTVAG